MIRFISFVLVMGSIGCDGVGRSGAAEQRIVSPPFFSGNEVMTVSAEEAAQVYRSICLEGNSPSSEGMIRSEETRDGQVLVSGIWIGTSRAIMHDGNEALECAVNFVTMDDPSEVERVFMGEDAPRYDIFRVMDDSSHKDEGTSYAVALE